jgi:hypothetical protein
LAKIDALAPQFGGYYRNPLVRMLEGLGAEDLADSIQSRGGYKRQCVCCGRMAKSRCIVVAPRTLHRFYEHVCNRKSCQKQLADWQGTANARRERAKSDWEHENGMMSPFDITKGIPVQYPSLSRATLRAFLDSGLEAATVQGAGGRSVAVLNGSIRSLGFADEVYAEIRSGEAVLRRVPSRKAAK